MPQRRARRCSLSAAPASFSIVSRSQLPSATRITFHDHTAVPLFNGNRDEPLLDTRAVETSARIRRISRTVRRAYQMQAPDIKELPELPVQFHGYVRAAIEVGVDPPAVAHRERRFGLSVHFELETYPVSRIHEVCARANYAFCASHRVNSSIFSRQARGASATRSPLGCAP